MFIKRTLSIIMVIVGGGWPAVTPTPTVPAVPVTLDEALAQGLANSRHLADIEARVDAAGFVVEQRATGDRPDVAFLGGYTRTNHVDVFAIDFPLRPSQVVYPDIPDNFRTRLDLRWPIYSSGRVDALERAAQAEKNAVGEEL